MENEKNVYLKRNELSEDCSWESAFHSNNTCV